MQERTLFVALAGGSVCPAHRHPSCVSPESEPKVALCPLLTPAYCSCVLTPQCHLIAGDMNCRPDNSSSFLFTSFLPIQKNNVRGCKTWQTDSSRAASFQKLLCILTPIIRNRGENESFFQHSDVNWQNPSI